MGASADNIDNAIIRWRELRRAGLRRITRLEQQSVANDAEITTILAELVLGEDEVDRLLDRRRRVP